MMAGMRILGVLLVLAAVGAGVATVFRGGPDLLPGRGGAQGSCATTVAPGHDIGQALFQAAAGATVCLAPGVHRSFAVARTRPGLTLKGAGIETTIIQAERRDTVALTDLEGFTITDLTVRGGNPAGIFTTRVRGLTLRGVRVEAVRIGVHADGGSTADLADVTIAGSREFGLLLRRGGTATGREVRVLDHRGIGIGAVDMPGPLTLHDSEVVHAAGGERGEGMVLNGWQRFTLTNLTVRGGNPAGIYVAKAREFLLRGARVESGHFGVHLDENANATLDDVQILGSTRVGLLLQRGGTVTGRTVRVLDAAGTGVSAINGPGALTLRDSEIGRVAAAGLFAGVAGCADLPPASLTVPECFLQDLQAQISTARVLLERLTMYDTQGPCLVFFAGVRAEVRDSTLTRCELTGLFAWGAVADVSGTRFEDNAEHALEYRAFPDPRGSVLREASGTIEDSVIHGTRPLEGAILGDAGPGPVLGGGILAQGARLVLRRNEISANRDIGIAFVNRSSGEVVANRILNNGNFGLCILPGTGVEVRDNTLAGNRSDHPNACGGLTGVRR